MAYIKEQEVSRCFNEMVGDYDFFDGVKLIHAITKGSEFKPLTTQDLRATEMASGCLASRLIVSSAVEKSYPSGYQHPLTPGQFC